MNDPETVAHEYATEDRFLARRLSASAELHGPLVEDATVEAVANGAPTRILEVGCGTGDFSARVHAAIAVPMAVLDLSHRMAELCRARGLDALTGDIEALPFADATFDCVLANRVLYHLPDLDRGLAEIARVLRPGSQLVAVTYSADHLRELWDLVGQSPIAPTFTAESGGAALAGHFDRVDRHDFTGTARFPTRESILSLLRAFGDLSDIDLGEQLGAATTPFDASYRHSMFIASRRASS